MSEHIETPRSYTKPEWNGLMWSIEERDGDGEVTAEFGYPTEAAARTAYKALTGEDAPE